jgi:hypothetical protein
MIPRLRRSKHVARRHHALVAYPSPQCPNTLPGSGEIHLDVLSPTHRTARPPRPANRYPGAASPGASASSGVPRRYRGVCRGLRGLIPPRLLLAPLPPGASWQAPGVFPGGQRASGPWLLPGGQGDATDTSIGDTDREAIIRARRGHPIPSGSSPASSVLVRSNQVSPAAYIVKRSRVEC